MEEGREKIASKREATCGNSKDSTTWNLRRLYNNEMGRLAFLHNLVARTEKERVRILRKRYRNRNTARKLESLQIG